MSIEKLVHRCRSYRRFNQSVIVEMNILRRLVDLARHTSSAMNLQPLRYYLSTDPATNDKIFPQLAWAGYLNAWPGPEEGQRPPAYIVVTADRNSGRWTDCDLGIACQSILLGAVERGLGGCIIAAVKREALAEALEISEALNILVVLAIGEPAEAVILDPVGDDGDIKYWRDADGAHHVPKRALPDIIIGEKS